MRYLDIYFLNVGHGDCIIIDFPPNDLLPYNHLMVVDINNSNALDDDSLEELRETEGVSWAAYVTSLVEGKPIEALDRYTDLLIDPIMFLKAQFPGRNIFRMIVTHPHADHISGLYRLRQEGIRITNFWDTDHNRTPTEEELNEGKLDPSDWEEYQRLRSNDGAKVLRYRRHKLNEYYQQDGVYILSPCAELTTLAAEKNNYNILSYVLKITFGSCNIILGGDAMEESWDVICEDVKRDLLKCNLLKASHHGRKSGFHEEAVNAMDPEHVIVSVGKKPATDASNKYRKYGNVYSTRFHGTILARCFEDGDVYLYDSRGGKIS